MTPPNGLRQHCREGLLLVGHGTRDAAGIAEFFAAAARIAEAADRPLEACFLELARPTIAEGLERLVSRGAERIVVVPLLLFAAGHAKRDIPVAVAAAAVSHPRLVIRQTAALQCHERILALSARRYLEAIETCRPVPPEQTLLLLVGRGSLDPEAIAEMHRFARLRAERTPVGRVLTCFVAMQSPSLADGLADAAASDFRRVVVQPHLLFSGQLLDEVCGEVERHSASIGPAGHATESHPSARQWIVTAPLGPEPELAAAVMDIVDRSLRDSVEEIGTR